MSQHVDAIPDSEDAALRARSGAVRVEDDRLTSFLYELMRDHLATGVVEGLLRRSPADVVYTNGWLANYARDVSLRLRGPG